MTITRSGPLLLIAGTLGLWVVVRVGFVALDGAGETDLRTVAASGATTPPPAAEPPAAEGSFTIDNTTLPTWASVQTAPFRIATRAAPSRAAMRATAPSSPPTLLDLSQSRATVPPLPASPLPGRTATGLAPTPALPSPALPTDLQMSSRWSLTAALHVREGGNSIPALGSGGQLGGTQSYARLGWRPGPRNVEIFARVNSVGRLGTSAEAALGVSVRPLSRLPIQLVAERRQRLGTEGCNAFALYAVGGFSTEYRGWRLDGYGAAGVVGASRRDAFAEGSATLARPVARLGPVELSAGGGAWGAAQPGVERLDIGPTLTARSDRLDGARLALDWRQRVAGNATPNSGPALTLSVDF